MPDVPRQRSLASPAPVPVHDDGDVPRHVAAQTNAIEALRRHRYGRLIDGRLDGHHLFFFVLHQFVDLVTVLVRQLFELVLASTSLVLT